MIRARFPLQRNQAWISLAILSFGLWLAWSLGSWIVAGDTQSMMFAALGLAFCAIVIAVLRNWRMGFYAFLVWLLFEDLFRKYMGNNMAIYFGKDVLVAIVYLAFFISIRAGKTKLFRPPVSAFPEPFFLVGGARVLQSKFAQCFLRAPWPEAVLLLHPLDVRGLCSHPN